MKNENSNEFIVQIYDKNLNIACGIELPKTQNEVNEILDFYELDSDCNINICKCKQNYLRRFIPKGVNIFTLNLLAEKLSKMGNIERNCFEGMMRMEYLITGKKEMPLNKMLNIADATDKCQYIPNITNNEELASFYDINNLYSKVLEKIPDDLMDYISFERLGDAIRNDEFGVYTTSGYVHLIGNIEQKYKEGFVPELEEMEGTVLLNIEYEKKLEKLWLPASEDDVLNILDKIGAEELYDCNIVLKDCIVPSMMYLIERELKENTNMDLINEFAFNIREFQEQGKLNKYKAIIEANKCNYITFANDLANQINKLYYCKECIDPTMYATVILEKRIPEIELNIDNYELLFSIGNKLMTAHGVCNTEFGTIAYNHSEVIEYIQQAIHQTESEQKIVCENDENEISKGIELN